MENVQKLWNFFENFGNFIEKRWKTMEKDRKRWKKIDF